MPIYEYHCRTCDNQFEVLTRMIEEREILNCPRCGGQEVDKIMSTVSIVRPPSQIHRDRMEALSKVNPGNPQEVARHFKEQGSRFGEADFRGKNAWKDAVNRVAEGGPTLENKSKSKPR